MRISDWSSDVCSSDLSPRHDQHESRQRTDKGLHDPREQEHEQHQQHRLQHVGTGAAQQPPDLVRGHERQYDRGADHRRASPRSEEHTSELQSLMRISYAVFCLKKKINIQTLYLNSLLSLTH